MAIHKFIVGEDVTFSPSIYEDSAARELYTVVRLLPAAGTMPQYRLKSASGRERVSGEGQLSRSAG